MVCLFEEIVIRASKLEKNYLEVKYCKKINVPHKIVVICLTKYRFSFSAYIWENKFKLVQFYLTTIIKVMKIQEMVLKSDYRIFWSRRLKIVLLVQKDAFTTVTESGNFSNFILYLSKTSVSMVYSCQKYGWSVLGPIEV